MKTIYEFLLKSKTAASTQHNDYVDLGLPSGLLWARCNIGADDPYEYGDYFMWGSTEPNTNDNCDWKYAPFNNHNTDYDEYYFKSIKEKACPNDILAPEYDAASVILGKGWRLPTKEDFEELIANTKREWIKNYQGSNINGMVFASKNNDAELFIPAAGYRERGRFHFSNTLAYLWSSSLGTLYASASYLLFDRAACGLSRGSRQDAFCLRGVKNF